MSIYSHSKLSSFEQCPYKYKLRYIDKIIPEIGKSIEAHLGTCVHDTLEWLYKKVLEGKIPTIDEAIVFYSESWKENYTEDIVIVKNEMQIKDYFEKGVRFLLDYYIKHQPFDDNTLELEKKIILELEDSGKIYKIRGFIDRLAHNLATNELEIHDYKTAGTLPSQDKIDDDRQLSLYSIAIKQIFGQEKQVCQIWHYLNFNKKICTRKTDEELEKLKKETIELINKIESTTEFPTNKSTLCSWCEYKSQCPEWKDYDWKKDLKPDKPAIKGVEINLINKESDKINSENLDNLTKKSPCDSEEKSEELKKYPTLKKYLKE